MSPWSQMNALQNRYNLRPTVLTLLHSGFISMCTQQKPLLFVQVSLMKTVRQECIILKQSTVMTTHA